MPKLVRLYIQSVAIGFGISAAFVALLLWSGIGGLSQLIERAGSVGYVAVLMMISFFGAMFSGLQFAYRIMSMAESDEPPAGGKRDRLLPGLVPVKVTAEAETRRQAQLRQISRK